MSMPDPGDWTGTSYISTATFRVPPVTGPPTDPTSIAVWWQSGSDPAQTMVYGAPGSTITKVGVGIYSAVIPTTSPGDTTVKWSGTGTAAGIGVAVRNTIAPPGS